MSLLVLTPRYVPLYSGGALQEHRMLSDVAASGVSVQVLTLGWPGLPARETIDAVRVRRSGSATRAGRLRFAAACIATVLRGRRRHRAVLAMAGGWGVWLGMWTAHRLGLPTALRLSLEGADDPEAIRRQRLGRFKHRLVDSARRIVCLTPALADSCRRSGIAEERICLMPNAVDLEDFVATSEHLREEARAKLAIPPEARVGIFLGALSERKRTLELLDAWAEAGRSAGDSLLLLCGPASPDEGPSLDPAYLARVRRRVERDDLRGRVRLTGLLDREEVRAHLRASDIYVSLSRAEGLPNAVLEAMAVGLPVLVTASAGSLDAVIEDGVEGWLVDPRELSRYVDLLSAALAGPERLREMGRAARRRIEDGFSMEIKTKAYRELMASLGIPGEARQRSGR